MTRKKYCIDCRFVDSFKVFGVRLVPSGPHCRHAAAIFSEARNNPVTGEREGPFSMSCANMRRERAADRGGCGPEGNLFEEIPARAARMPTWAWWVLLIIGAALLCIATQALRS
jgi:hypothetical protein